MVVAPEAKAVFRPNQVIWRKHRFPNSSESGPSILARVRVSQPASKKKLKPVQIFGEMQLYVTLRQPIAPATACDRHRWIGGGIEHTT